MAKFGKTLLSLAVAALAIIVATGAASAGTYSGVAYCNVNTSVSGNTPTTSTLAAGEATGTECATFSTTSIDFSGDFGNYTIAGFLSKTHTDTASGAFGISFLNGFTGTESLDNSLWVFTGTASFTNGQSFNVGHDDGTEMYVNGTNVLSAPGPTGPTVTPFTYTGTTGTFGFEFIYTECCGGTADYDTTLAPPVSSVPEPTSLGLLGAGLLGIFGVARRRLVR